MNGTRIRINVLRINDLRSTLTSIRVRELYINNIESASETQGFPSSEIEIMLLIICRRAGVFVRNTLRPSVLSLTECHSWLSPFLSPVLSRFGACLEWHSVKLNTLGLKVLRTKTPAHRLIHNNMISISLDPKPRVSEAYSIC